MSMLTLWTSRFSATRGGGSLRLAMLAALVGSMLAFGPLTTQAHAAAYTVGTTADSPGTCRATDTTCSLREAINAINAAPSPPDTITIPRGFYQLGGTVLSITQSVQIYGAGNPTIAQTLPQDRTTSGDRVFDVQVPAGRPAPTVGISALIITGGTSNDFSGDFGGDIHNAGTLTLTDDTITNGFACSGGGVSNDGGTLTIERSTITGNHGACGGGDSGGIQNHGTPGTPDRPGRLFVDNSTVSGNDADLGAGIFSWGDATNSTLITNSTIASNSTQTEAQPARGPGAGLLAGNGTIRVQNSIVAKNTETTAAGGMVATNCSTTPPATIVSQGYNLDSGTDCGFTSTGDLQGQDPLLSTLFISGWLTATEGIDPKSPAFDHVPAAGAGCPPVDQRGVPRPQGAACDIGAFEYAANGTTAFAAPEGASAVTANAATLNGLVNYNTLTYHFEYGTTPQYGSRVPTPDAPVRNCDCSRGLPESQAIGGLLPSTVYHFRVVTNNAAGTFFSADQTFVTAPGPPSNLAPPTISGTPQVGSVLSTDNGSFAGTPPLTYTYQWQQCDATGANCQNIPGATTNTYAVGPGDVGHTLTVIVTAHNGLGQASATAAPVAATAAPAAPSLTTGPPSVASTTSAAFSTTVNPNGLPTTVHFEYGRDISYGSATPEQQVGSDRANHTVTMAVSGLLPNSIYHVRAVASNSAGSVPGNDVAFSTPADPPPPAPVLAKSVNVEPVSGQVFVKLPAGAVLAGVGPGASAAQVLGPLLKGQGFIPLTEARQIPVGSTVDASAGTVRLTTATATRHKLQFGDFSAGIFKILQQRKQRGLTSLSVVDAQSARQVCAVAGKAQAAGGASAARARVARRRLSSTVLALLNGNAHGRFTTSGRYSAATVRGTKWSVSDRCDGTLTRVTRGVVVVRDFRRHRNITVRAGRSYLAKAPGA